MRTQPLTTTAVPLYGSGIHVYLVDELELGERAAAYLDSENNCGWSARLDLRYAHSARSEAVHEAHEPPASAAHDAMHEPPHAAVHEVAFRRVPATAVRPSDAAPSDASRARCTSTEGWRAAW